MGICGSTGAVEGENVEKEKNNTSLVTERDKPRRKTKKKPSEEKLTLFFKQSEFVRDTILLGEIKKWFKRKKRRRRENEEAGEDDALNENMTTEEKNRFECMKIFERFDKWDFDVFRLSELTNGFPLIYCAYAYMIRYDLFKKFVIDEDLFLRLMERIQECYFNNNQFHNCTRAASILQSYYFLIRKGLGEYLSEEDYLSSLLACCIIYMDHPGLDNHYQACVESYVATIYNDTSILENTSCYLFVKIVFEDENYNIFRGIPTKSTKRLIRETIIDMVISTDFNNFGSLLEQFRLKIEEGSDFSSKEDIRVLLQISLLYCSVDYCCKPNTQYRRWISNRLVECFNQGKLEKEKGFPIGRFNNPERKIASRQSRFLDKVKQLIKPMIEVFSKMKAISLKHLRKNKEYWATKFSEPGNTDFADLRKYEVFGVEEQQDKFIKKVRAFPIPEDQARNVPMAEQTRQNPITNEDDTLVFDTALKQLKERWSVENQSKIVPHDSLGKAFALVDVPSPVYSLTNEERIDSIMKLFDRIDEWNFDVFCLQGLLNDDCLYFVTYLLFIKYDWIRKFRIDEQTLIKFLKTIQNGYQRNPYHNNLHATDVMQITNSICIKGGVVDKMSDVDLIAAILGSVVHDLDHPGLNDAYQVHSFSYLAKLYNDRSVLEAHHCSETFRLMRDENMDIFKGMTADERRDCRKTMADMIISTDMCNHAKYVRSFNRLIESESNFDKKEDIRVALQIAIKMADVSNPSRPTYIYLQWTDFIITEFFRQGDKEKLHHLPVSPLMDSEKSVISKGQHAFMEYVLIPMFKSFASVFPKMEFTLGMIGANKDYWRNQDEINKEFFAPTENQRKVVEGFVHKQYPRLFKRD